MPFQVEKRKYPRLSITTRNYQIRFQIKGLDVLDSRLVNLSAGGCGLEVQIASARLMEVGDTLEALYLDHPDLPLVPLSALVLRMLGRVPGKTSGYVLVGTEFQGITPMVEHLIESHVAAQLARD
jgi:hypothetical protein